VNTFLQEEHFDILPGFDLGVPSVSIGTGTSEIGAGRKLRIV
jgi:hypothetical protein